MNRNDAAAEFQHPYINTNIPKDERINALPDFTPPLFCIAQAAPLMTARQRHPTLGVVVLRAHQPVKLDLAMQQKKKVRLTPLTAYSRTSAACPSFTALMPLSWEN
jgi:hypothetical protein